MGSLIATWHAATGSCRGPCSGVLAITRGGAHCGAKPRCAPCGVASNGQTGNVGAEPLGSCLSARGFVNACTVDWGASPAAWRALQARWSRSPPRQWAAAKHRPQHHPQCRPQHHPNCHLSCPAQRLPIRPPCRPRTLVPATPSADGRPNCISCFNGPPTPITCSMRPSWRTRSTTGSTANCWSWRAASPSCSAPTVRPSGWGGNRPKASPAWSTGSACSASTTPSPWRSWRPGMAACSRCWIAPRHRAKRCRRCRWWGS